MKKTFIALFLSILLLTGCGPHWQVTKPDFEKPQDGQVVKLEQLTEKSGANVVRAFTALTGGGTGSLDKISRTTITNGDIAMVVTGNIIYFYQYNSSATDAEVSPTYIRPNDYATSGVWYLVDVRAKGVNTGTSSTPSLDFYDLEATDGDINAKIYVNCTTTTSGAEVCQMYFQTQVAGTLATRLTIDATGNVNTTAFLGGKMPIVEENTATTFNITTAQAQANTYFLNINAGTKTWNLPAAEAGMAVCIKNGQGVANIMQVDTDGTDYLVLPTGARNTAGKYYGATASATNQICLAAYNTTDWYIISTVGTWTIEP
jgi:hypothetical protein